MQYGLDTSQFTYNPSDATRYQQNGAPPAEERSRCTVMWRSFTTLSKLMVLEQAISACTVWLYRVVQSGVWIGGLFTLMLILSAVFWTTPCTCNFCVNEYWPLISHYISCFPQIPFVGIPFLPCLPFQLVSWTRVNGELRLADWSMCAWCGWCLICLWVRECAWWSMYVDNWDLWWQIVTPSSIVI